MGAKSKTPIVKDTKSRKPAKPPKQEARRKPVASKPSPKRESKPKVKPKAKTKGKTPQTSGRKRGATPRAGARTKSANPREIETQMTRSFELSAKRLTDLDKRAVAAVRTFKNADGSVSGEMRVAIASNQSPDRVLHEMSVAAKSINRKGTWVQVGFVFAPRPGKRQEDEVWKLYNRNRGGGFRVGTFFRERDNLKYSFLTARQLLAKVKQRKRGTPTQVYVRMHWSPKGERPKKPVKNRKHRK